MRKNSIEEKANQKEVQQEVGPFDYLQTAYQPNKAITGDYDKTLAVKCVNGTFVGKKDGDILSFKGIPFVSEQPIGKNRFKAPIPFKKDDGVYEAYYFGKACAQVKENTEPSSMYETGEDCLTLNVWTNAADKTPKKAVMVWFHGGAYQFGGTVDPLYDMTNFLNDHPDVIIVTCNYRLGLLGYMQLKHLPGGEAYPDAQNNGLLDQVMALRWVHENIAGFGGDPNCVTIYGQSAGGGSVSTLAVVPESRSYIRRVIAMSGTNGFLRTSEMAEEFTRAAMEAAGVKTLEEWVNLPIEKIIEVSGVKYLRTVPMRGDNTVPLEPWKVMANGDLKGIDFMQGTTRDENNFFCFAMGGDKEAFNNAFETSFNEMFATIDPAKAAKAREFMKDCSDDKFEQLSQFGTQVLFAAPCLRQAEELTKAGGKVFQYFSLLEAAAPGMGAQHSVEMGAIFDNPDYNNYALAFRQIDETFSKTLQCMWVKFAKTGNPSLTAEESPTGKAITWEQYNLEKKPVMVLEEKNIRTSTVDEMNIIDWERTYPLSDYYFFMPK